MSEKFLNDVNNAYQQSLTALNNLKELCTQEGKRGEDLAAKSKSVAKVVKRQKENHRDKSRKHDELNKKHETLGKIANIMFKIKDAKEVIWTVSNSVRNMRFEHRIIGMLDKVYEELGKEKYSAVINHFADQELQDLVKPVFDAGKTLKYENHAFELNGQVHNVVEFLNENSSVDNENSEDRFLDLKELSVVLEKQKKSLINGEKLKEENVAPVSDPGLNDDTSGPPITEVQTKFEREASKNPAVEEQPKRENEASKEKLQESIDADVKIEVRLKCEREASKEETDKTVEDSKLETNVGAENLSGA